ncbi:MAG TPA: NAD(P)H-hydrate epimerase, partial [Opitutus sp.]|nr:NAD(P)H-hydrate epimerase [Opitutus sp.]
MIPDSHPILSCDEAKRFEAQLFGGDEAQEWSAMEQAGRAIAEAALHDIQEIGGFPVDGRILVLVGKGHNGGDALIAARTILEKNRDARADVVFAFGLRTLRPLAARAWQILTQRFGERILFLPAAQLPADYDLCLDGIFGFQFRPPMEAAVIALIERVNAFPIRCRVAVDLPSGGMFRA